MNVLLWILCPGGSGSSSVSPSSRPAVGITLPGVTRVLPWLVVWAAAGVAFVMVSATVWHVVRGEISSALTTLVLLGMAGYVVWMRHRVLPIRERRA
jgi:hypothetical protein